MRRTVGVDVRFTSRRYASAAFRPFRAFLPLVLGGAGLCGGLSAHPVAGQVAIELEERGQLRLLDAPAAVRTSGLLAMKRDRSVFALTEGDRAGQILIFDEDGRFVRALGGRGGGPGEYAGIRAMAFDGADSLWVFDVLNQRLDVYGPDLELVRTMGLSGDSRTMAPLALGGMVVAATGLGAGQDRFGIHVIRGEQVATVLIPRGSNPLNELRLASAPQDRLWVAWRFEHRFQLMGDDGSVLRSIDAEPEWWDEVRADRRFSGMMVVDPSVSDVELDGEGRLWVSYTVPTPSPDLLQMAEAPVTALDPGFLARQSEGIVQVVDPATGSILAERRGRHDSPPRTLRFLDESLAYSWEPGGPDDLVDWRLVLWDYRLSGGGR